MPDSTKNICVSENDIEPVYRLVASALKANCGVTLEYVQRFAHELRHAKVVPASRLPAAVIRLNSRVWISNGDSDAKQTVTLVLPHRAGSRAGHISVISPLGMALFGYATGDRLDWGPLQRPIRLRVDRVKQSRSCPSSSSANRRTPSGDSD